MAFHYTKKCGSFFKKNWAIQKIREKVMTRKPVIHRRSGLTYRILFLITVTVR